MKKSRVLELFLVLLLFGTLIAISTHTASQPILDDKSELLPIIAVGVILVSAWCYVEPARDLAQRRNIAGVTTCVAWLLTPEYSLYTFSAAPRIFVLLCTFTVALSCGLIFKK